jgi:pathogenesis-related protein 1
MTMATTRRVLVLVTCAALVSAPALAAKNPCRVACRTARKACFQAAGSAFVTARSACATLPGRADRRTCKQSARVARAAAKATCRFDFASCASACSPVGGATTTTLPGACGDAEAPGVAGITAAHNRVRAQATPTPDPALPKICYSAPIAAAAQSYANGCVFKHDTERLRNLGYGENLYAAAGSAGDSAAKDAVPAWACEATNYDFASRSCSLNGCPAAAGTCGHYTQLVWRDTDRVGCGIKQCTTNSPFQNFPAWTLLVCDYAPPGNITRCNGSTGTPDSPY